MDETLRNFEGILKRFPELVALKMRLSEVLVHMSK